MSRLKQIRDLVSGRSRDAPQKRDAASAWMCSPSAFTVLLGSGYQKLSNCPEVQMCVDVYADLISSMTLHLMENTEKGDIRVKDGLARKLDISPNKYMTRKSFIWHIVQVLMLEGTGHQVTYPQFEEGLLDSLDPLKPSGIKFT